MYRLAGCAICRMPLAGSKGPKFHAYDAVREALALWPADAKQMHEKNYDALGAVLKETQELQKREVAERNTAYQQLSEQTVRRGA